MRRLPRGTGLWIACLLWPAAAGCGKKAPAGASVPETPEYREWRTGRIEVPVAGFAPEVRGRIVILPPGERSTHPEDFCELFVNGRKLYRLRVARRPDGEWPTAEIPATFRTGPNWIDLWDSSSNTALRRQVDTRQGTDFELRPTEGGYELHQSRQE